MFFYTYSFIYKLHVWNFIILFIVILLSLFSFFWFISYSIFQFLSIPQFLIAILI